MNHCIGAIIAVLIASTFGCARSTRDAPVDTSPEDDGGSLPGDGGDDDDDDDGACDPFESRPEPIELGAVIAAGEDAAGTIYVVSRPASGDPSEYVFVSEGSELVRQRIAGSGSSNGMLELSITEHTPPFRLIVFMRGTGTARIQLAHDADDRGVPLAGEAETLETVGGDRIEALTLRNLPGEVRFEHGGALEDGRVLIVTRPEDDWSYEDFRVFFGPLDRIVEREVFYAGRGSSTIIELDIDGQRAEAGFPSIFEGDPPPSAWLGIGNDIFRLESLAASPVGASYRCTP